MSRNRITANFEESLLIERIQFLYRTSYSALMGVFIVSLFLVIALWITTSDGKLLWWMGILTVVIIIRSVTVSLYNNAKNINESYNFWSNIYVIGVISSGSMWGIAGFLFFNPDELIVVVILITFTLGVSAGAATSISVYYPAFFGFIISAVLPLAIRLFIEGGVFMPFGGAVIFYIAASTLFARQYHKATLESLRLRFENIELIERVTREKERVEQEKQIAEDANIAKSKFLAATSHDLRQPLHALGLLISTLESTNDPYMRREILNQTKESVTALDDLFNSLLDISKLDAGIVDINIENFSLNDLFNRFNNEFSALAKEKNVELSIVRTEVFVSSDPVLLDRILRNLISNAVTYTQVGKILVGAKTAGNDILIGIWDQGDGIPENELENVFSEFRQLHNPERDRTKGLGLGLAIVKRLCNLLDHTYQIRSIIGKGTYFKLKVPKANDFTYETIDLPESKMYELNSRVILVIDDERAILESMRLILTKWGCKVFTADSASNAIEQIGNSKYKIDLIISDYRLRDKKTGIEAIRIIETFLNSQINGILISGDTSPEILKTVKASGFPLLHKPVKPAQLKIAIACGIHSTQ